MTKTEALNKSAQEAGFPKFDKTLFKHFEKNEVELENIIRRAMDIYVSKWISVEDRLPEVAGYYLVVVDEKAASSRRGVVEISDFYKTIYSGKETLCFQPYVTHWQPLPTAP